MYVVYASKAIGVFQDTNLYFIWKGLCGTLISLRSLLLSLLINLSPQYKRACYQKDNIQKIIAPLQKKNCHAPKSGHQRSRCHKLLKTVINGSNKHLSLFVYHFNNRFLRFFNNILVCHFNIRRIGMLVILTRIFFLDTSTSDVQISLPLLREIHLSLQE